MRVMGEGLLRKRPCFPKTWRREPSMQMLGKGHLGGGGGDTCRVLGRAQWASSAPVGKPACLEQSGHKEKGN